MSFYKKSNTKKTSCISIFILILFCMFSIDAFAEREAKTPQELDLLEKTSMNSTSAAIRLINNGVAINITDIYGQSLLMFAVEQNNKELVRLLIKKGANLNYRIEPPSSSNYQRSNLQMSSLIGQDVLDFAIKKDNFEMFDLLIELGAKLHNNKDLESFTNKRRLNKQAKEKEIRLAETLQEEKKTRTKEWIIFFSTIFISITFIVFRKKIKVYSKQISLSMLSKYLTNVLNQIKLKTTRKNKTQKQQNIVDKRKKNRQVASFEKGWTVDDTIELDVNYLTIEDIINPIRMVNQHERHVREMIWYVRKIEKTNVDKKEACDILASKWKQVNPKQVRGIYKRSLSIILENYSQKNSKLKQLSKEVKAK